MTTRRHPKAELRRHTEHGPAKVPCIPHWLLPPSRSRLSSSSRARFDWRLDHTGQQAVVVEAKLKGQ
eukprot:3968353-Pyramimonas_sp.AAC.1